MQTLLDVLRPQLASRNIHITEGDTMWSPVSWLQLVISIRAIDLIETLPTWATLLATSRKGEEYPMDEMRFIWLRRGYVSGIFFRDRFHTIISLEWVSDGYRENLIRFVDDLQQHPKNSYISADQVRERVNFTRDVLSPEEFSQPILQWNFRLHFFDPEKWPNNTHYSKSNVLTYLKEWYLDIYRELNRLVEKDHVEKNLTEEEELQYETLLYTAYRIMISHPSVMNNWELFG